MKKHKDGRHIGVFTHERSDRYPWNKMRPGDSCWIYTKHEHNLRMAAFYAGERLGCHFTVRKSPDNRFYIKCLKDKPTRRQINWPEKVGDFVHLPYPIKHIYQQVYAAAEKKGFQYKVKKIHRMSPRPHYLYQIKRVK